MIDLYPAATPNSQKTHIMLEQSGLGFGKHWINIDAGEQFDSDFPEISANNKIPALVDHDGPEGRILLYESGEIFSIWLRIREDFFPKSRKDGGKQSNG